MPFSQLPASIASALSGRGYDAPTSVQAAVIEESAHGRDLLVSAQTGSGKTVAFGIAMAEQLLADDGTLPPAAAPLALIIAPTRELAMQVSRELEWLYADARGRIATCVGGMDAARERRALAHGAHIVVGTPGRLRDHLERGALDLSALTCAVLDEADEMLDMGFREDLEEILDGTPDGRRTLLFSATMPRPIVALAKRYQRDALRISTLDERQGHGDISYQAITVSPADIEHAVINLLRYYEAETAMLFCATRDNVRHLHASLVERGFAAVALSGEHSQNERNHALQALRDGRARVCVATDVAARGIDVASLSLVVHVEIPRDPEVLQHRSGRTGRAGRKGTAVLIVPYSRRRRVESILRAARVDAEWTTAPSADMIRERDRERLIVRLSEPVEAGEEDVLMAERLLAEKDARDIAVALVRAYRQSLPEPEELIDLSSRDHGDARQGDRGKVLRPGFDDCIWFRMDIGRRHNADPRWILPLLCRRGHISRDEVGAIRISANQTHFQIPRAIEARFRSALQRTAKEGADDESGILIEASPDTPREVARTNARQMRGHPQDEAQQAGRPTLSRSNTENQRSGKASYGKPGGKKAGFGNAGDGRPHDGKPPRDGKPGRGKPSDGMPARGQHAQGRPDRGGNKPGKRHPR